MIKQYIKKIIYSILIVLAVSVPVVHAARTQSSWLFDSSGYIFPAQAPVNVLIQGINRYLNFGTFSGSLGYGFRDNSGIIEFKNNGGSWTAIGTGGSGTNFFTNSGVNTYLNKGSNLEAPYFTGTSTNTSNFSGPIHIEAPGNVDYDQSIYAGVTGDPFDLSGDTALHTQLNHNNIAGVYLSSIQDDAGRLTGVVSVDPAAQNIFMGGVSIGTTTAVGSGSIFLQDLTGGNSPAITWQDANGDSRVSFTQRGSAEFDMQIIDSNTGISQNAINMNTGSYNEYQSGAPAGLGTQKGVTAHEFYINDKPVGGFDYRGWFDISPGQSRALSGSGLAPLYVVGTTTGAAVLEGTTTALIYVATSTAATSTFAGPVNIGAGQFTFDKSQSKLNITGTTSGSSPYTPELDFIENNTGSYVRQLNLGGSEFDIALYDSPQHQTNAINMNFDGENEYSSGAPRTLGSIIGPRHVFYIDNTEIGGFDYRGWLSVNSDHTSKSPYAIAPLDVSGRSNLAGTTTSLVYMATSTTATSTFAGGLFANKIAANSYIAVGSTATSTIQGATTGTSTFQGFLNVLGTNSTSTFSGNLSAGTTTVKNLTSTNTATSTFAGGLNITSGCYATNGACPTSGGATLPAGASSTIQYNANNLFAGSSNLVFNGSKLTVSNTATYTIGNPADTSGLPGAINYGSGDFTANSFHWIFDIYAYKNISGTPTVFSATPAEITFDDNGSNDAYYFTLSWTAVAGAAGYFVIPTQDDWDGYDSTYYFDVGNVTSFEYGTGAQSSPSSPTPTLNPSPYDAINGTALAVVGNETVSGTLGVAGNTGLSGTLDVTGLTTMSSSLNVLGNRVSIGNPAHGTTAGGQLSIYKCGGAPTPNGDSNAVAVFETGSGCAANMWFNLPNSTEGFGSSGEVGFTVDGAYKSGMVYDNGSYGGVLSLTNNIASANPTTGLFVSSTTGYIGIETRTPVYPLDVSGDANITGCYRISGVCQVDNNFATSTGSYRNRTSTISSVNTYTPTASSTYSIDVSATVDTVSIGTVLITCTYTNTHGTASTYTFGGSALSTAVSGNFAAPIITPMKNTAITVVATVTGTITYDIDASIIPVGTVTK